MKKAENKDRVSHFCYPEITEEERNSARIAAIWRNDMQFIHDNRQNLMERDQFCPLLPWCEK
jgi:hypothetical protein